MILVTGATGIIGAHVLYELTKTGKSVRAMYRTDDGIARTKKVFSFYQEDPTFLFNQIEWKKADINDRHAVTECMQGIHQVYHTAGLVSFNDKHRKELNRVNIEGTEGIVNACLETGSKLCHISSIASLGELAVNEQVDEKVIWNRGTSASAYAISKYKSEMEVWRGIHEGLEAVIINPSVVIGPGMWMGPAKFLFTAVKKGLKFYPPGSSGYVDVRDVAQIMTLLSESGITGERFIINAGHMTHYDFLNHLAEAFEKKGPDKLISPFLSQMAVIGESFRAFVTGSTPRINGRTFSIASEDLRYSSQKIIDILGVTFTSIEDSVKTAVQIYKTIENS